MSLIMAAIGSQNVRNNKKLFFRNLDDRTIKLMEKPGFKPFDECII